MPPERNNNPIEVQSTSPVTSGLPQGNPSQTQQSWGVVISIVVIVGMIVVGAFYAWGKRIAQNVPPPIPTQTN